jgi:hypothetical protein
MHQRTRESKDFFNSPNYKGIEEDQEEEYTNSDLLDFVNARLLLSSRKRGSARIAKAPEPDIPAQIEVVEISDDEPSISMEDIPVIKVDEVSDNHTIQSQLSVSPVSHSTSTLSKSRSQFSMLQLNELEAMGITNEAEPNNEVVAVPLTLRDMIEIEHPVIREARKKFKTNWNIVLY